MKNSKRILAVASAGGHWVELLRILPAFEGHDVAFVSTQRQNRDDVPGRRFYCVLEASMWSKLKLAWQALQVLFIVLRERPRFVVSTGAAPGYWATWFARWLGAKTVWIDSLANADELSLAGRVAGRHVSLWLTQWPHLERQDGPKYRGTVL